MEFERLSNAAGPTGGQIVMRDGKTVPKSVGIVHCVGSRDKNYNNYCSAICCMQSLKFAHLVHEKTGAEVYNFYIDIRTPGKTYDEFYRRILDASLLGRAPEIRQLSAISSSRLYDTVREAALDKEWQDLGRPPATLAAVLDNPVSAYFRDMVSQDRIYRELLLTDREGRLVAASIQTTD